MDQWRRDNDENREELSSEASDRDCERKRRKKKDEDEQIGPLPIEKNDRVEGRALTRSGNNVVSLVGK